MRKWATHSVSLIFGCLLSLTAWSQDKYPSEPEAFVKALERELTNSDRVRAKEIIDAFEPVFLQELTADQQRTIIKNSNRLDELRVRVFPDLANYIRGVLNLQRSGLITKWFGTWHSHMDALGQDKRKKRNLTDYIEFTERLFRDNILYSTTNESVVWKADNSNYTLEMENGRPMVHFESLRLACYAKGDSLMIEDTKGSLDALSHQWKGEGGTSLWTQSGFAPTEVFAKIERYEANLRKPEYKADSVVFTNTFYFSEPLLGSLEDKIISLSTEERRSYPRFQSYDVRLPIRNIIDKVDYDGGFSQQGPKFLGSGTELNPARLLIHYDNRPFMIVESPRFLIRIQQKDEVVEETRRRKKKDQESRKTKNRIVAGDARIIMLLGEDSIVHPGLKFTLFTDDRQANLLRRDDDLSSSPYANGFHNVEMDFELMQWNIDDPYILFTSLLTTSERSASFNSNQFFKAFMYDRLMGISSRHPLAYLKLCADKWGSRRLTLQECVECVSLPPTQVEPMLLRYQMLGYVDYDQAKQEVLLKEKLIHHVLSKSRMSDYDVLQIRSDVSGKKNAPNARLSLLNYDLNISGVNRIILSDSHKVQIFPAEGKVTLKKNRDFDFSGLVSAGKAEYYGKGFSFKYNDFQIEMPIIDSLQLWADTEKRTQDGVMLEARVQTVIEDLRGNLKIDQPGNKSGLKSIKKYPIFTSEKESYAYYDQSNVHGGVYDRGKFYFQLEPFVLDSLDKFRNESIKLKGSFVSAGIFPDMEEVLVLQPDYSLGFTRKTPASGLEAYGGKGIFKNDINLSNKGLRGDGFIEYITATAESKSFYFFPDSVNGVTRQVYIEEQLGAVEYPAVSADTTFLHWMPYRDYMDISSMEGRSPIDMYAGTSKHEGTLRYGPNELIGWGKNSFEGANLYSDKMLFKFYQLLSDTCDFELGDELFGDINFSSENLNAEVDFQKREGTFVSNTGASLTRFGETQYQAFLDRFTWKMDAAEIEYSSEGSVVKQGAEDIKVEGAEFVSIHPRQDSLRWFAKAATYSVRDVRITAREVENIDVADASIIPGDGIVVVNKNARMNTLDSARVIANRRTKYHTAYDATIDISGRFAYRGTGSYDYKDENSLTQTIILNTITVDSSKQTFAEGVIPEEQSFSLSPRFSFKGDVRLEANEKNLLFDGTSQIIHACQDIPKQWFRFESRIDPQDINIEITDDVKNEEGQDVTSSLMIPIDDSIGIYSTFLSQPYSKADLEVMDSKGFLVFDKPTKEFRISSFEKLNERSLPGNYIALNTETCVTEGEGRLNFSHRTSHVTVQPAGRYTFNTVNKELAADMVLKFEFLFDDNLFDIIVKELQASESAEPVDLERPVYPIALRDLAGKQEADELLGRMSLGRSAKLPDALRGEQHSAMVFSDVQLTYDPELGLYLAKDKIGIGNIGKELLNMYVTGGISFETKRQGTDFMIYLDLDKHYYIFKYRASAGIMQVYSNNDEFTAAVNEIKNDKRRIKASKTNKQYIFQVGSKRLRSEALSRFESIE